MQIIDCEQGSEEWLRARMGIPTASAFADILSPGRGKAESKTRRTYLLKLAGEILTGELMDTVTTRHMERGKVMEDEARDYYAFTSDAEPQRVGFIVNGRKGCSPDSLVGETGALEIKTAMPHILAEIILKGEFPEEHKAQTQGVLWVAEREWIDLAVYWPKMPRFVVRAHRDETYIKEMSAAVDKFNEELDQTVERLRAYGQPVAQAA